MSQDKDPNQGEGDRISARRYDRHTREFIAEGNVPDAANEARLFVERDPDDAAKAEQQAKRGPRAEDGAGRIHSGPRGSRLASVDELIAKGHSMLDRVRPMVDRLRARFGKK